LLLIIVTINRKTITVFESTYIVQLSKGDFTMTKFTEYVNASAIWATAKDYTDLGERAGFVRGYNVEVRKGDETGWLSCSWINGDPNDYFNDAFHAWCREEDGLEYTGRICFRGYGIEKWDPEERDYYIVMEDEVGQTLLEEAEESDTSLETEDSEEDYEEPYDIDSDMGFDPYMGCYTYDC
jgi:hypothetical protein